MTYKPKNLERWTLPPNYFGEIWPAYFSAGVGQSRDSDALEQSNFDCLLVGMPLSFLPACDGEQRLGECA